MTPRERLIAVLDGLRVETSERYRKRDVDGKPGDETFCNWLVSDVCNALNVFLPAGFLAKNQIFWLRSAPAKARGWNAATERRAWELAEKGHVVVVGWVNPDAKRSSHVAILHPAPPGNTGLWITQAGAKNYALAPLARGFGDNQPLEYYAAMQPIIQPEPVTRTVLMPEIPLPPLLITMPPEPRPSTPTRPSMTAAQIAVDVEGGGTKPAAGGWAPTKTQVMILSCLAAGVTAALALFNAGEVSPKALAIAFGNGAIAWVITYIGGKSAGTRTQTA